MSNVPCCPGPPFLGDRDFPGSDSEDSFSEHDLDIIEEESEESDIGYEIPSLDDIIPWSPSVNNTAHPPPLVDVLDSVHSEDGINQEFLRNVLRSHFSKDQILREVIVQGYTSELVVAPDHPRKENLIEVNVDAIVENEQETFHLVIKTLPPSQNRNTLCTMELYDRREVGMYTQILRDISIFQRQQIPNADNNVLVPSSKCFFGRYVAPCGETSEGGHQAVPARESVVVLENLKYQGYRKTHLKQGLCRDEVLIVIQAMSHIHGLSLAMKERSGIPLERSYPFLLQMKETTVSLVNLFEKNLPDVLRVLDGFGAGKIHEKILQFRPHLPRLIETLAEPRPSVSVLAHMNLWSHNILFKENRCIFVDWQMITCTRPSFDLAFLLATSVKTITRRRYTDMFLRHYYAYFTSCALKYGLDIEKSLEYTMQSLEEDFRCSQFLAAIFWVAKAEDLLRTREQEFQFVDYLNDISEQDVISLGIIHVEPPQNVTWTVDDMARSAATYRLRRQPPNEEKAEEEQASDQSSEEEQPEE